MITIIKKLIEYFFKKKVNKNTFFNIKYIIFNNFNKN